MSDGASIFLNPVHGSGRVTHSTGLLGFLRTFSQVVDGGISVLLVHTSFLVTRFPTPSIAAVSHTARVPSIICSLRCFLRSLANSVLPDFRASDSCLLRL